MSTDFILARLSLFLIQAGLALVLSLVLWHFYRIYQRHYLKSWSVAFLVFAAYVICLAGYSTLGPNPVDWRPLWLAFEFSYIFSCYAFAIWVLVGVREAVTTERIPARTVNQLLWLVGLIAVFSVAVFAFEADINPWKRYLQVNLRLLFIGSALLVAGVWLFSLQNKIFVTKSPEAEKCGE